MRVTSLIIQVLGTAAMTTMAAVGARAEAASTPGVWNNDVQALAHTLAAKLTPGSQIFVQEPVEEGREQTYYPFLASVKSEIENGFANAGITVTRSTTEVPIYVSTVFQVLPEGLLLKVQAKELPSGTVLTGSTISVPADRLPASWNTRSLRDVAYELVDKLMVQIVGENVTAELGEFRGGRTEDEGLVSVFGCTMRGYVAEELGKTPTVQVLNPEESAKAVQKVYTLRGEFAMDGENIIVRLRLLDKIDDKYLERGNVSARFPVALVPDPASILPPNASIMKPNTAAVPPPSHEDVGAAVAVWTDHDSGIYRPGDTLNLSLYAKEDCYVRLYYIQSDGRVFQLHPSPTSGDRLNKGQKLTVTGQITAATLGQESVKVFAAHTPIDDSAVQKALQPGGIYAVQGAYTEMRDALRAAGRDNAEPLRPVAELNLVVAASTQ